MEDIKTITVKRIYSILHSLFNNFARYDAESDDFVIPNLDFEFKHYYTKVLEVLLYMTSLYCEIIAENIILEPWFYTNLFSITPPLPNATILYNREKVMRFDTILIPIVLDTPPACHALLLIYNPSIGFIQLFDVDNINAYNYESRLKILDLMQEFLIHVHLPVTSKALPMGKLCIQLEKHSATTKKRPSLFTRFQPNYDPTGYCAMWVIIYIETLVSHPDKNMTELVQLIREEAESAYSFTRYIRTASLRRMSCLYRICKYIVENNSEMAKRKIIDVPKDLLKALLNNEQCYQKPDYESKFLEMNKQYFSISS